METFDWSPTRDRIAVANSNMIRVFEASFGEEVQCCENIFNLDTPDGKPESNIAVTVEQL